MTTQTVLPSQTIHFSHYVYMVLRTTAAVTLNSIKRLVFVVKTRFGYCAEGIEFLRIKYSSESLNFV